MTRHRKRKIAGAVKLCLLMVLPLAVGAAARGIPEVKEALSGFAEADLGKNAPVRQRTSSAER